MRLGINDMDFINSILRHPDIYPNITDDFSPQRNKISISEIIKSDSVHIISPNENAVIFLIPRNGVTWEMHYNVLKVGRGDSIRKISKDVFKYAFTQIENCKKIVCYIAEIYKNAIKFATDIGFKHEGRFTKSIQKNGNLYDEIIMGIRCEQWQH